MHMKEKMIHMSLLKKFLAAACAVAMIGSLAACGGSSSSTAPAASSDVAAPSEAPAAKTKLRVGTSADFPPYEFHAMDANGKDTIVGADIELAKYVCEQLGYELEIVDMGFDGLIGGLKEGAFDMIIAGFSITPEREAECLFSKPYFGMEQAVLVREGDKAAYATVDTLMGKKVGGQMGSIQEGLARQYAGESAVVIQNVQDMVMMLMEGQLDALIVESTVADNVISANPSLVKSDAVIEMDANNIAIAFQKENTTLRDQVNEVLDTVIAQKMVDTWVMQYQEQTETAK